MRGEILREELKWIMLNSKQPTIELSNLFDPDHRVQVPSGIILLSYRGSIAHGMYVPKSDPDSIDDVDLMGAVIGGPEHYFGLQEWGSRGTKEIQRGNQDCVFYELRKLVSLLLQGNPNVLSLLWTEPRFQLWIDTAGRTLIQSRRLFVGKHVYNAFAGYAHAQMEKMELRDPAELRQYLALTVEAKARGIHPNHKGEKFPEPDRNTGELRDVKNYSDERVIAGLQHYLKKGENIGYMGEKRKQLVLRHGYDAKNAAHLIRLLRMCLEFLGSGQLTVFRPDAQELLAIKRGEWSLERVKKEAETLFEACRAARETSSLPEYPDRQGAQAMLVSLIRGHLDW